MRGGGAVNKPLGGWGTASSSPRSEAEPIRAHSPQKRCEVDPMVPVCFPPEQIRVGERYVVCPRPCVHGGPGCPGFPTGWGASPKHPRSHRREHRWGPQDLPPERAVQAPQRLSPCPQSPFSSRPPPMAVTAPSPRVSLSGGHGQASPTPSCRSSHCTPSVSRPPAPSSELHCGT